jgi:hypothetical protein
LTRQNQEVYYSSHEAAAFARLSDSLKDIYWEQTSGDSIIDLRNKKPSLNLLISIIIIIMRAKSLNPSRNLSRYVKVHLQTPCLREYQTPQISKTPHKICLSKISNTAQQWLLKNDNIHSSVWHGLNLGMARTTKSNYWCGGRAIWKKARQVLKLWISKQYYCILSITSSKEFVEDDRS